MQIGEQRLQRSTHHITHITKKSPLRYAMLLFAAVAAAAAAAAGYANHYLYHISPYVFGVYI